jgi:predicted TPR repeat methyltransferase
MRQVKSLGIDCSEVSILDVGCGTGFYVDIWKQLGCKKLAGIDITFTAIEKLRMKYPEYRFFRGNIGNLDNSPELSANKYDIISAFDVLFHIVDDEQYKMAFKNIYDLLKEGGTLMFSENFVHTNSIRSSFQTSRSSEEIEDIILKTGFKIVKRSPFFILMNTPIDTKNSLLRINWKLITKAVKKDEKIGYIVGAFLYPIESILVMLLQQGPSTELMICIKE